MSLDKLSPLITSDSITTKFLFNFFFKYVPILPFDPVRNIFEFLSLVNAYVDNQAPWSLKKTNISRMVEVLYVVTLIIIKCSILLFPIMPSSINKILHIYNLSIKDFDRLYGSLPPNISFSLYPLLISKFL